LKTYLAPIGGREDSHCASTLFDVPKEPQSRHLMGLGGHVHIDKQSGKAASGTASKRLVKGYAINSQYAKQ